MTVLGDGARWIWNLAAEHFERRIEILDCHHAYEHLWVVARTSFGEGTAAAKAWVDTQITSLLKDGSGPLLAALPAVSADTAEDRKVLQTEREYFRRNAARLDYPTFRKQGLPIGSGAVESSAGYLIQFRMKRPGASWSPAGAQGTIAVRCRLLSKRPLTLTPAGKAA